MSVPRGGVGKSGRRRGAGAFEASSERRRHCCCRRRSLADHRAIGFACQSRRQKPSKLLSQRHQPSEETYTYFIGSFFLSSMASASRERTREK